MAASTKEAHVKPSLLILSAAAILVAAAAGSSGFSAASTSSSATKRPQIVLYGHIRSIARKDGRFEMRFDPAWWLTGVAAERACGCRPVSNDYYIVDESHRTLTFVVRRDADVSVLTRQGTGPIPTASISVTELAQIVAGKNPKHRRLLEPKAGFWIRIGEKYPNPAVSLDQQYQP
jgi:hypothetical protein